MYIPQGFALRDWSCYADFLSSAALNALSHSSFSLCEDTELCSDKTSPIYQQEKGD